MCIATNQTGFTLIEIIVTLILVGIMAVLAGMGITRISQGFLFTQKNAETLQKGQMAMSRLIKEFTVIDTITSGDAASMAYSCYKWFEGDDASTHENNSIAFDPANNTLVLSIGANDYILTDKASDFMLKYYDDNAATECAPTSAKVIQIALTIEGADGITSVFTNRITPRNIAG